MGLAAGFDRTYEGLKPDVLGVAVPYYSRFDRTYEGLKRAGDHHPGPLHQRVLTVPMRV